MEAEEYAASVRIAERQLMPRARNRAPGTECVADGFGGREQFRALAGV